MHVVYSDSPHAESLLLSTLLPNAVGLSDLDSLTVQITLYRPLAGALASLSAAAIVPSFNNLISSLIAFVTTTSVSPSTRM